MNRPLKENTFEFSQCPWFLKDVFIVFIYAITLFFVFCFWLTVFYFLMSFIGKWSFQAWRHTLLELLKGAEDFYAVLLFYAALFIAMKTKIFKKYKIREFDFFIRKDKVKEDIFYGFLMYLKFIAIMITGIVLAFFIATIWDMTFGSKILEKVNVFFIASDLEKLGLEERGVGVVSVVVLFILAPFFEELFFRGCLYRALRVHFSRSLAIASSSFIFSLLHGYFFLFVYVFLVGLFLAYMYEKRKSLVAPLTFHMLNNLVVVILFLFR